MQSAFQQRLKAGARGLDAQALYPRYRSRFEKFDRVFGAENVELIPFDPDALYGGDVVQDFGRRIGVEVERGKVIRSNQSLSLEATALLFAARHFTAVGRYKRFARDERARIALLSKIGKEKLIFAPSLVAPVLDNNRDDIEWMSQRLGWPIEDAPRTSDRAIASEADLFEVAVEQKDALWQLMERSAEVPPGVAGVAELVDRLHAVTAQGLRVPARANPSSWLSRFEKVDLTDATLPPARLLRLIANALAEAEPDVAASLRVAAGKVEGDQPVARLRGAQQEAPRP